MGTKKEELYEFAEGLESTTQSLAGLPHFKCPSEAQARLKKREKCFKAGQTISFELEDDRRSGKKSAGKLKQV